MPDTGRYSLAKLLAIFVTGGFIVGASMGAVTRAASTNEVPHQDLEQAPERDPGALIGVKMNSQVGVLLDEIPESTRDRAVIDLLSQPEEFWSERAHDQVRLMSYRLVFRDAFYDESEAKGALPLPPEEIWNISLRGEPYRTEVDSHDLVLINYTFASTLLTDPESPGASEQNLESVGGKWQEPFILPIDPQLMFQRTEFACMDENQFPPRSVDAEEVDTFYDQETEVEDELSIEGYHVTVMPETSCVEALDSSIGKIETSLLFKRLPWNSELADKVRVGEITNLNGADLKVEDSEFKTNRVVYRYIESDSCSIAEQTVGASGWRRLLQFSAADRNIGGEALEIGDIDYYIRGNLTELSKQGIYEYSLCHNHYHFKHYGSFTFGDEPTNHKMGFCLQSTNRFSNNEQSPLPNRYSGCDFQGIEAGWVDEYKAGLEGQWVDITNVDTSKAPVAMQLSFHSNPDSFLCEGTPVLNSGNPLFEPTEFKTDHGQTVYRQVCNFGEGALQNNVDSYDVTLPTDGNGYVTEECMNGEIGPLRNCGFEKVDHGILNCTPGEEVRLDLAIPEEAPPQVVRACDFSFVMGTGIPCTYNGPHNARSLANIIIQAGSESGSEMTLVCPSRLNEDEPGGRFALYLAPVLPDDRRVNVGFLSTLS